MNILFSEFSLYFEEQDIFPLVLTATSAFQLRKNPPVTDTFAIFADSGDKKW